MGEVYRARDTTLDREVALKFLPESLAADPDRLMRFEREAKTLASLNHSHIAQIYGIDESSGVRALVMELVEGEDLSQVIARGPIPLDEALPITRQVAEALDAAHGAGIVHRDLKPANIKVRPDGTVKVLDFGLAKAMGGAASDSSGVGARHASPLLESSPTMTSPAMTAMGMILGTAAYMSPEQARGRTVDRRTDIWAFGCVLFEMLTGQKAFPGDTVTDVLGAVVRAEPEWGLLPASMPLNVMTLLKRCLHKDTTRRLRDIGDAIGELESTGAESRTRTHPAPESPRPRPRIVTILATTGAIAATALITTAVVRYTQPEPRARVQRLHLNVDADGGTVREPVISPDGTKVAYVGRSRLWVRSLDQWDPRELAGTEAAVRPFWSPDGNWIGYFRSESLLKVPAAGGPAVRVARLPAVQAPLGSASGAWADDGTIYVTLASGPPLRVPSGGGDAAPFMELAPAVADDLHDIEALPGGQAFLVGMHRVGGVNAIGVLKDNAVRLILEVEGVRQPTYAAPGYLVFERHSPNAGLWAAPFSLDSLAVTGEPFLIGEGIDPSAARDGTLVFIAASENATRRLAWFSMTGESGASVAEPREWVEGVALSGDQRRLLASASDGIWAYDIETGGRSRVTTDPSDMQPDWVSDDTIVFVRTEGGEPVVVLKRLGAGGDERVLARRARFPHATADGRRIVFNINEAKTSSITSHWEVAWVDVDDLASIHKLPTVHRGARFPSVSPDGTMVTYVSGETGRDEVFLTSLPEGEGKWQLSAAGGGWVLFSPRGDVAFFRAPDGAFMSVPVAGGAAIKVGQAKKLFDWGPTWAPFFDVAPGGGRGIAAMPVESVSRRSSLSIMHNWQLEFARQ